MRRPSEIERLYLDFDGFFASVEQQARPGLRGRPVGVVPFAGTAHTCVIACSREAKLRGVKNVMDVAEARRLCPEIVLIPQSPDLYRRAHNALVSEISAVLPVDAIKSIDELTCLVDAPLRAEPQLLGLRIKQRIAENIGSYITCSIGFAANRQLAKMACKAGKPNGNMVWRPKDMPAPLLPLPLDAVPGIGGRMLRRLARAGITTMQALLATEPKQMRKLWGNVTGERLWYALQGYDLQAQPQGRGMYGHGRVLPPGSRGLEQARGASRLLLTKAARRMRRDGWNAGGLWLWLQFREGAYGYREGWRDDSWARAVTLPAVHDDQAVLAALEGLWRAARRQIGRGAQIVRLGVTLLDLTPARERQLDLLLDDDGLRRRWERASAAIDTLNRKYGRTLVSLGEWAPPPGGYAGGKISYTRIPHAEDFW